MSGLTSAINNLTNSIVDQANTAVNLVNNVANNAINAANAAANVAVTQINAALAGPATIQLIAQHVVSSAAVGPGVIFSMPSNTDSQLALLDPLHFQGTIDFSASIPGVIPNGPPSLLALVGVAADHWAFSTTTNTLTLFAGSQVTDTLKMTPSAAGFTVFEAPATVGVGSGLPGGVVIASGPLAGVSPSVAVPLPGTVGP